MLKKIQAFFASDQPSQRKEHDLKLASAALLVEIMRADHHLEEDEKRSINLALQQTLGLDQIEAETLFQRALTTVEDSSDLHQFTRVIHEQASEAEKFQLVVNLWRVAFADAALDKYEEHMIRRIAELLYLPHSEFIRAKVLAKEQ